MSGLPRTQVHMRISVFGEAAGFSLLLPEEWKFRHSVASRPGEGQGQDGHGEQARHEQESRPAKHAVNEGLGRFPAGGAVSH